MTRFQRGLTDRIQVVMKLKWGGDDMIFMPNPTRVSYIKPDHEQVLVSQLEQAKHD
jgi:hypothetical protein